MIRRFVGRVTEFFTTASNVVSRTVRTTWSTMRRSLFRPSNDWSRPDYEFYRRAYRCQVRGLEISGLFLKPLCSKITSWTLGRPPGWKCANDASQKALDAWWDSRHVDILKAMLAGLKQGDSFLVVNSDLSVTLLPPDTVEPIVAEDDYGNVIGWRATQVLAHPTRPGDKMTLVDEYTAMQRIHRIERNGIVVQETIFPNLLGRLPIIHVANQPDEGQRFGHPEAEGLVEVLHRYGEVFEAAIEGNKLQGRPTPVLQFETVADLDKFWALYGKTERQTLPDGRVESYQTLSVDLSQLLTVSGAELHYASPGSFAGDTETLLGLMFYLILEHTEIPEFVFGNAIASSKASAEAQMPVFETFIEGRRREAAAWLTEVAEIVLGYLSLMQPGVSRETPTIQWAKLTQDGRLTLETITWAFGEGLLDERTAVMLMPVDVEDVDAVLEQARREREERRQQVMEQARAMQPQQPAQQPPAREIAEMLPAPAYHRNGSTDPETAAIVAAAERIVANGDARGATGGAMEVLAGGRIIDAVRELKKVL
ncbi:MAG: hypothetical protein KJZ93_31525 [Caldilineaceae bacterium]|nr:hypothetical protein [Caldilineaceae bacterium]